MSVAVSGGLHPERRIHATRARTGQHAFSMHSAYISNICVSIGTALRWILHFKRKGGPVYFICLRGGGGKGKKEEVSRFAVPERTISLKFTRKRRIERCNGDWPLASFCGDGLSKLSGRRVVVAGHRLRSSLERCHFIIFDISRRRWRSHALLQCRTPDFTAPCIHPFVLLARVHLEKRRILSRNSPRNTILRSVMGK